jgi:hypothetical protein
MSLNCWCRCRVIPLVSRNFNEIHTAVPSQPKELDIEQRVTPSMVEWFGKAGGSLERLSVAAGGVIIRHNY